MGKARAHRIANTIREYWQRLGVPVNVWIVNEHAVAGRGKEGSETEYTVRSDLVAGLPQNLSMAAFKRLVGRQFGYTEAQSDRLPPLLLGAK